jgi:signal recognition particle-docking protein FtsY
MFSFFKRKKPAAPPEDKVLDAQVDATEPLARDTEPPPAGNIGGMKRDEIESVPGTELSEFERRADLPEAAQAVDRSQPAPEVQEQPASSEPVPTTPSSMGVPSQGATAAPSPTPAAPISVSAAEMEHSVPSVATPSLSAVPAVVPVSTFGTGGDAPPTPAGAPEPQAAAESGSGAALAPAPAKRSWLARLKQGLSRTGQSIGGLFVGVKVDEDLFEELETALIMADAGVEATEKLLAALRARVKKERLTDAQAVKAALRDILTEHLKPLEKSFPLGSAQPLVVMIAGVNGAGKTTSIGKLAHAFQAQGASVLLAAADTFRAAAREQLMEWGARNNVTVVAQEGGDPAAVAFDSVNAGRARQCGVVMVDTAGRLPTQLHLMEELKKIKRVIRKADGSAPHEVLLVVDGNTGQNVIAQVKAFDAAIELTGLVVTKLDGTAKGGTLAAIASGSQGVRPVPVYWIGVGEGMHDLQPFVAREFAAALVGD